MKFLIAVVALTLELTVPAQDRPLVVVELFTSEGCSSCPPGDRLLSSILNEGDSEAEIVGLSFHVDYWDYIGWKDPYSDPRFSKRQRKYARQLISSVYTPQMVVNGNQQFVGSSRSDWKKSLNYQKQQSSVKPLKVSSSKLDGINLRVTIESENPNGTILHLAVVEKDLSQQVNRGENRGRKLFHDNVVRVFATQKQRPFNAFELTLPKDLDIIKSSLIAYTQDETTLEIKSVKKIELSTL